MANAKKCDRCGKFFDRCQRTVEIITSNDRHRNISFDCGINDDLDLCDDCIKSFEDWWANRTQIKIERKDPSETNFNDYLAEQMKDPEFKKEYEKIVDKEPKERIHVTSRFKTDLKDALYRKGKPFCVVSKSLGLPRDCITKIVNGYTKRITKDRYYLICEALNIDPEV